ncbi:MAG: protein-disulfide reductase DsbD family protein [Porticoccaceae bacterium]|nr:protein-disulfide reductase DsbD family protein [Porticoccaceae bacterium]
MKKILSTALLLVLAVSTNAADKTIAASLEDVFLPEPTERAPLAWKAVALPADARPGDTVQVAIKGQLKTNWHIYAYDPTQVFAETSHSLTLPENIKESGDWELPGAEPYVADPNILVYHDELLFTQNVVLGEEIETGKYEITVNLKYQACDPYRCLPPKNESQTVKLQIR